VVLSRSGLTRLVDKVEAAGLLRRESCSGDRRGSYSVMAEAGLEARRAAWPTHSRAIMELFVRHLNEEEAQTLAQVLGRVVDSAREGP
jgi:DNA-binding MarR family transcriptional regulator